MEQIKIEADTSKYDAKADRILAAAECIKAQAAGKDVQSRRRRESSQWVGGGSWSFDNLEGMDYRVKPEPVVTYRTEWAIYVPKGGEGAFNHPLNRVSRTFPSREAAFEYARRCVGYLLVVQEDVRLVDGKEVSREVAPL